MMEAQPAARHESSCKGCSADVRVSELQIERLLASLDSKGFNCVSDEEYERRLKLCRQCSSLLYSTTCRHCGCIVQVRAKIAEKHCPIPGKPNW